LSTSISSYDFGNRIFKRVFKSLLLFCAADVIFLLACNTLEAGPGELGISLHATLDSLENGLKVILLEDHSIPVISYQTFFRVGSRNEVAGITGISHFMEHMMFNGAGRYGPGEFDRILETNGGTSNAYTSKDMTAYYEDIASSGLELVIDLDSDRMASLALAPEYLSSEMGVVMEERRLSIDNSVEGRMYEEMMALAYKAHPYRWPVLGWMSDLKGICREDCLNYYRSYYAPNNAVVVVAGDFDTEEALQLIRSYYDTIPDQQVPCTLRTVEPEQMGERRAEVIMPARLSKLMIGYHGPSVSSKDIYPMTVLEQVLGEGESSRLHKLLVRELEIATSVYVYFPWRIDPGMFIVRIEMKPGCSTLRAESVVYGAIDSLITDGVSESELIRAKNVLRANLVRGLRTVNSRAGRAGRYEILFGDYLELSNVVDRYYEVSSKDVREVAEKYLHRKNRNVVTLIPE
jgi:zinc protease